MWSASGCARCVGVARRIASRGSGCTAWPPTGFLDRKSFIHILTSVSPSHTQGGSRVRESRSHGSGRGAVRNDRPYRASPRVLLSMTDTVEKLQLRCAAKIRPNDIVSENRHSMPPLASYGGGLLLQV